MSTLIALAPFAALLALLYIALAVHVVRYRYRHQLALGTAEDAGMLRAVRAHANFGEYAPFSLLMIALVASLGGGAGLVTLLGALLVIARVSHAYSLLLAEPRRKTFRWRMLGMVTNFLILTACALFLLWQWAAAYLS